MSDCQLFGLSFVVLQIYYGSIDVCSILSM